LLEIKKDGKKINILNACDLGRTDYDTPIVRSPQKDFPVDIDYVVIEATYGDRTHAPIEASLKTLEQSVLDADKNRGKLVMPAFSMMRTHLLWSFLYDLTRQGRVPDDFMFYSSSPSADDFTRVMLKYIGEMDQRAQKNLSKKGDNYFDFEKLVHHEKSGETLDLIESSKDPFGIIAASGMCDHGRVVSILERTIYDPKNIVLLTGYCSPGTRGDLMMKKTPKILFESGYVDLRADVRKMGGLSGHADVNEITSHLKYISKRQGKDFKGIFIKHGESEQCDGLKNALIRSGFDKDKVYVMEKGKEYVL
jgi:metallo-beta-lactamase family protein